MSIVKRSSILVICLVVAPTGAALASHDGPARTHVHAVSLRTPAVERERIRLGASEHVYESVPGWCRLPDDRPLGNTHGGIVIDPEGHVLFNTDTDRSIVVFQPNGTFVRTFADAYPAVHGMQLRVEEGRPFLYVAHLRGKQVLKLDLDGNVQWRLGVPMESHRYDDDPNAFNPTAVAVAPDGSMFIADGYGRSWIHQFDSAQQYVRSFGGPGNQPGQFQTCHGMIIDERGPDPRLVVCDRENRRLQRFDLDGNLVDVPVTGLRRPCSLSMWRDVTAVAELEGRVTILDASFQPVVHLGDNPRKEEWANNGVPVEAWHDGVFTAPHAVCFDDDGNLYVMDWNATGRVSKLRRVEADEQGGDR